MDEFFAVEKMTARMVNNIAGPTINGTPVNAYIYMLLTAIAAGLILYAFLRRSKINWPEIGKKLLVIIFAFWLLLEARGTLNYLSYLTDDLTALFGKTLDEKRAITSPVGLYEFTQLVNRSAPKGTKVALLYPPQNDFIWIKLKYYIAPLYITDEAHADFVAGYLVEPNYKYFANTQYGWVAKK